MLAIKNTKTFLLIFSAAALSFLSFLWSDNAANKKFLSVNIPRYNTSAKTIVTVTPAPVGEISFGTPDGKKTLTMKRQSDKDLTSYSFYVTDEAGEKKTIFNQTGKSSETISIPFNAWSPDNNHLFLLEETAKGKNYLVFHASGKPFTDDSEYVNVSEQFKQKLPDLTLDEVTGWADPALLIVNVKTGEGVGRSFWFDINSLSFLPLGNYFK